LLRSIEPFEGRNAGLVVAPGFPVGFVDCDIHAEERQDIVVDDAEGVVGEPAPLGEPADAEEFEDVGADDVLGEVAKGLDVGVNVDAHVARPCFRGH